jgi:hypothetical protein
MYYIQEYYIKDARNLFTDRFNSAWHFVFGLATIFFPLIMPFFLLYQALDSFYSYANGKKDTNLLVDLAEYFIGYLVAIIAYYAMV